MTRNDVGWVVIFGVLAFILARLFEFSAGMTVGAIIGIMIGRTVAALYARSTWR